MIKDWQKNAESYRGEIAEAKDLNALEELRVKILGKKGAMTEAMKLLGKATPEERKEWGAALNEIKTNLMDAFTARQSLLQKEALANQLNQEFQDVTLPARKSIAANDGRVHPITQVMDEITTIFSALGFTMADGPQIEDDFHNFEALNIPPEHPARQMQDTFYFPADEKGNRLVLRTHTSSVQIRSMTNGKPPFRLIAAGRVYRCDSDMTHTPMFHQVEGLVIDKKTTMADLKGCLHHFMRAFFEVDDLPLRFRPSYFPFTEPSAEVDIGCDRSGGDLKIGAGKDWLEIGGCGMVHPNVLRACGVDPDEYQGYAFGMGIDRMAMLKYGIPDLRTFFDGDQKWLSHYGFAAYDQPHLAKGLSQ